MKDFDHLRSQIPHGLSPLAWRWEQAQGIHADRIALEGGPDRLVAQVVACLGGESAELTSLFRQAEIIFLDQAPQGWELEVRLLRGESDEEIAGKCRLEPAVVTLYHDLFFAVRDSPFTIGWLMERFLDRGRFTGFHNHQVKEFWLWFTLYGGGERMDEVIKCYHRLVAQIRDPGLLDYLGDRSSLSTELQVRVALAVIQRAENPGPWFEEFGIRFYELAATPEWARNDEVERKLHAEVIECGRRVLAGEALGPPPLRCT